MEKVTQDLQRLPCQKQILPRIAFGLATGGATAISLTIISSLFSLPLSLPIIAVVVGVALASFATGCFPEIPNASASLFLFGATIGVLKAHSITIFCKATALTLLKAGLISLGPMLICSILFAVIAVELIKCQLARST